MKNYRKIIDAEHCLVMQESEILKILHENKNYRKIIDDGGRIVGIVEEFEVEPPRWRADSPGVYYIITAYFETKRRIESNSIEDYNLYKSGNYFPTRDDAERMAKKFKDLLKEANNETKP